MRGQLKFIDGKSHNWGFIIPDDGTADIYFVQRDVIDGDFTSADAGAELEFDVNERGDQRHAAKVRRVAAEVGEALSTRSTEPAPIPAPLQEPSIATPGEELSRWAFIPFKSFTSPGGNAFKSVLPELAKTALEERWYFGSAYDPRNPYPILENYLKFTFFRLTKEHKIMEVTGANGQWAAFNTGLVDRLYDPIFALFKKNDHGGKQVWQFDAFCVPGKGGAGKRLTSVFDPLPEVASYFASNFEMLLDTSHDIHVDYDHVIIDGVGRDRFPPELLAQYPPKNFDSCNYTALERNEREQYLSKLAAAVQNDVQTMRAIKRRLEDAKELAEKRTRWNYKTAIPQYFPRQDIMSLLLPLAMVDDEKVDLALVVTRNPSGSYQGRTVFPLDWAYQNARLVCRPDSDWLVTDSIQARSTSPSPTADA